MQGNPGVWFEIYVQDMARAKRFYESVFQIALQQLGPPGGESEMWAFPSDQNSYGAGGMLVKMNGVPSGQCSTIIYFACADCATEESRVAGAGGRVEKSKFSIGEYGHIALVRDTEGNMVGLHSM